MESTEERNGEAACVVMEWLAVRDVIGDATGLTAPATPTITNSLRR
jgi:hypothetical protein